MALERVLTERRGRWCRRAIAKEAADKHRRVGDRVAVAERLADYSDVVTDEQLARIRAAVGEPDGDVVSGPAW